jgi:hypothetical protein
VLSSRSRPGCSRLAAAASGGFVLDIGAAGW